MLSYRHAFHAGNFADVLKHSVLHYVLGYMQNKDKGFCYIDTHSGAGMYRLQDDYAQKTGEYKQGIEKLFCTDKLCPLLADYVTLIRSFNKENLALYPGSPAIAQVHCRKQDQAKLFELHKADYRLLNDYCSNWKQASLAQTDGYQGLVKQLPPKTRRGVVLIDPPYEIKTDYTRAVETIIKGYKKFATGTYILWYPVVKRSLIDEMEASFIASNVKNVLKAEFCMLNDSEEFGMTGTGLFIVNPPWQLSALLNAAMPELLRIIGNDDSNYTISQLIDE